MMAVFRFTSAVYMGVTVGDRVSMCHAVVGVSERVGVFCLQGVQHDQHRAGEHDCQRQEVLHTQRIPPDDAGERRSDKGRNGIIGAGFGGAQCILRTDVAEDA